MARPPAGSPPSESGHRVSVAPVTSRRRDRASQVPGPSVAHVPWSPTPPDSSPPRPLPVATLLPSGVREALGIRVSVTFRGCAPHGPLARLPTYRQQRYRRRRKARCRPAGLSVGRAGLSPAGRLLRVSSRRSLPPFPSDQHFLVTPRAVTGRIVRFMRLLGDSCSELIDAVSKHLYNRLRS
jgi:hypothetical protein